MFSSGRNVKHEMSPIKTWSGNVVQPGCTRILCTSFSRKNTGTDHPLSGIELTVGKTLHHRSNVMELIPYARKPHPGTKGRNQCGRHGVVAVMIDLRDMDRTADTGKFFFDIHSGAVASCNSITEIAGGVEAETVIRDHNSKTHPVLVQRLPARCDPVGVEVCYGSVRSGYPAVPAEVPDGKTGITPGVMEKTYLSSFTDPELLYPHPVTGLHPLVE